MYLSKNNLPIRIFNYRYDNIAIKWYKYLKKHKIVTNTNKTVGLK